MMTKRSAHPRLLFVCFSLFVSLSLLAGCAAPAAITQSPAAGTPAPQSTISTADLTSSAANFVDQLVKGDFKAASSTFDPAMQKAMPEATLKSTWEQLLGQAGAYQKQLSASTQEVKGYQAVIVTTQFEKSVIDIRVVFDSKGQIAGLQFLPGASPSTTPLSTADYIQSARYYVDELSKNDFSAAYSRLGPQMKAAITEAQLKDTWQQLIAQVGAYQKQTAVTPTKVDSYQAVIVTTQFEKSILDIRVVFDPQGQIAGMQFLPANSATTTPQAYTTPPYAKNDSFTESDVTVGSGEWALPGTLSMPGGNGPFPAVVLVHGSGPHDRDETIGPNKPFRDLAWGLASQGIAVLRYDKRTYAHASQFTAEILAKLTINEETVDDALLAVQLLRQTPGIDPKRIYILGHSLGAMAAPRIGQQDSNLAGLILLAGNSRPLEDVIMDQYNYLYAGQSAQLDPIATQVARVKDPSLSAAVPDTDLPLSISASYWIDLNSYHQTEVARSLAMPVLILQGGRDYQVSPDKDFTGWQTALASKANAAFKLYPALNHLFIAGEGQPSPVDYDKAGNVSQEVVDDIANWILKGVIP